MQISDRYSTICLSDRRFCALQIHRPSPRPPGHAAANANIRDKKPSRNELSKIAQATLEEYELGFEVREGAV
jgi:hypothetical protein